MTDVQARAGRIRELDQAIELGLGVIAAGLEAVRLIPARLPFQLDFLGIVSLAHEKFLLFRHGRKPHECAAEA